MLAAVMIVFGALALPLLTTTQAQSLPFTVEELLGGDLSTRSGTTPTPCLTPEGRQGMCGSAITCSAFLPLLSDLRNTTVINFFRERVCRQRPGLIHVCCPLQEQLQTSAPAPRPQNSPIFFNPAAQAPRPQAGSSQRPNARRPGQGGFTVHSNDEEDEEREFSNPATTSTHSPPKPFRPLPPPPPAQARPTPRPTTTTRAPTLVLPQFQPQPPFMRPDREPPVRGPAEQNNNNNPIPTEPSEPPILPAEGECGQGRTGATPWVVSVGVLDKSQFQVICAGALISRQHVITAAHCLHSPGRIHVRLGDMQQPVTLLDVPLLSWVHPDYSPAAHDNDLALLTLDSPVNFTDTIQPVCLPFRYRLDGFREQQLQVVGWSGASSLQAGTVQVTGLGVCRDAYGSPANNELAPFSRASSSSSISVRVDRRHLCASPAPSGSSSSSCLSDFGAPLFYHDRDTTGLHFLAGVSSLGDGCATRAGLYTRIGAFIPWLVKQLSAVEASAVSPTHNPTLNRGRSIYFG
ncbi:Coagulation factor X [Chionoecetes opilio]|uniref:CLIP domain-containing serine protease n=1 Tax=Chionoecetes opilio TaxID=41210 RepID=A0A8J4XXI3_CHIOP|nr:Coagulation factor X [Chionoecetes opilio]